jgi:bacterioferritin-associated ferredoxin
MIVCLCTGSTDRDIERALQAGAGSLSEIGVSCRAGLDCGRCQATLQAILCRRSCENCPNGNSLEPSLFLEQGRPEEILLERSP